MKIKNMECTEFLRGFVIDPFAGSGSVGEACAELGLRFEGCELSAEYSKLANERLGNNED